MIRHLQTWMHLDELVSDEPCEAEAQALFDAVRADRCDIVVFHARPITSSESSR